MKNIRNAAIILATIFGVPLQVSPVAVATPPEAVPTAEVVYYLRKTVSLDGRVRQEEPIDRLGEVAIDLETLRDDQGRKYQIEADASQEQDGSDVTYELRVL